MKYVSRRVTEALDRLLVGLAAASNKTRLGIMLALYDSIVTEGVGTDSLSFTDLRETFFLQKGELSYHLNVLKEAGFVKKEVVQRDDRQYTAYELTDEAMKFLKNFGITENTITEYREKEKQ